MKEHLFEIVPGNTAHYTICTWEARDSIKDPFAFSVYFTLKRFADFKTGENCFKSVAKLIENAGVSRATFFNKIKYLIEEGWVEAESRKAQHLPTKYKVNDISSKSMEKTSESQVQQIDLETDSRVQQIDLGSKSTIWTRPIDPVYTDSKNTNIPLNTTTPYTVADSATEVFNYWQKELAYPDKRPTTKRIAIIKARLNDGLTVEELKKAVDYVKGNEFLRGKNDRNRAYDDIINIFRNTERVEEYIILLDKKPEKSFISTDEERSQITWKRIS